MPKIVRACLVIFAFVVGPCYLNAATTTSVTFWLCNAGKTDVDVFCSQSGQVTSKHVGSADCVSVAHKEGAMGPGYVGLGFTDVRGQWGAPRRLDLILESDREAFDTANESTTVKRGNANVALPMKLYFHPAEPRCEIFTNTPVAQYPSLNPTPTQKARAEAQAAAMATHETICQQLEYTLNVEAYPDTKELAFKKYCDICDKKAEATATPEERAARQQRIAAYNSINNGMVNLGGAAGALWKNVMNLGDKALEDDAKERAAELAPPMRINWKDMTMYLYLAYRQDSRMKPVNHHIIVQGTVQSVTARNANNQIYDVYFTDDTKHQFAFCTARPDILQDVIGSDFASKMVGKNLEVEGYVTKGCRADGGIQITLARQLHVIGPGQAATVAHVWSPDENPIPPTTPAPSNIAPANTGTRPRTAAPTQPAPSAVQPVQPAPAPLAPPPQATAARGADPMVETVMRLLRAKTPEPIILETILGQRTPHNLSGADRARLEDAGASERVLDALTNPTAK